MKTLPALTAVCAALVAAAPAPAATFSQQVTPTAADALANDAFGLDVGVSGDTLVVASAGTRGNAHGAAYVFERGAGSWADAKQTAKLTLVSGSAGAVDIS